jgi:hypothetical protein
VTFTFSNLGQFQGHLGRVVEGRHSRTPYCEEGVSGYIDDGSNRWPAVRRLDAANLVRRCVNDAPAASALHATAEDGVPSRAIAEAIGRGLDLPVVSIPERRAAGTNMPAPAGSAT